MSVPINRPATADDVFLWIMHRFADKFSDHAILKGGMSLRLIDSPRFTKDIDYVFVPYSSKKEIQKQIKMVLEELEDAELHFEMHSKMFRVAIHLDAVSVQLEVNVSKQCEGFSMSTGGFASDLGYLPQVVRMMQLDHALAHKLAAWNERRLIRDLYDCYFYIARLHETPNINILLSRLKLIKSRIPKFAKRKTMSLKNFVKELREEVGVLTQKNIENEIGGLLPIEELAGLEQRLRAAILKVCDWLESNA